MGALLGYVWQFVNSTAGMTLVMAIVAEFFRRGVKSKDRQRKILGYAYDAFNVVEAIGLHEHLGGKDKYLRFIETIVTKLKAEGAPELSASEVALLQHVAYEQAWLAKPPPVTKVAE